MGALAEFKLLFFKDGFPKENCEFCSAG